VGVRLRLLGTGTPAPVVRRAGSACLLELDDACLLIDCGPGSLRRLIEAGVPVTRVTHLLLTHLHYDHCMDYAYLVLLRWDQAHGEGDELRVYGPAPVARMTDRLLGPDGAFAADLCARIEHPGSHFIYQKRGGVLPRRAPAPQVTELADGGTITGRGWQAKTVEVTHVQPQLTSLAYRVDCDRGPIVFSGDAAPGERLTELARGARVLVHMCHFLNEVETDPRITTCCSGHLQAAQTARDAGVDTLVLVHMTEQLDAPGMPERAIVEASRVFPGRILWGQDLMEVPLRPVAPPDMR